MGRCAEAVVGDVHILREQTHRDISSSGQRQQRKSYRSESSGRECFTDKRRANKDD